MPIIKKREIEILSQLSGEELEMYVLKLPIDAEQLEDLFYRLHTKLENQSCNHTLNNSMQFIMERHLNFPKITAWLNNNGGYCDCKILENIEPEWRKAFPDEAEEDTDIID
jgi:hypothetical protein